VSIDRRQTKRGVAYDVRLRAPDGRPYKRTFRTRKQAETFQARELADRSRGTWVDPWRSSLTFREWAGKWLGRDPSKRQSSLARDESVLRNHLLPALGSRKLATITPWDIQDLVNAWSETASPRTVRRQYDVVRAVFTAAVDDDRLVRSPCRNVKLPSINQETRRVITSEELGRLGARLGPDWSPMLHLGAVLGLRWGECAGLRVGRLDFDNRTLAVAEQLTRVQHGLTVSGPPKSAAGRRTLSVPSALMDLLAAHMSRRGLTVQDAETYVFSMPEGGPLDYAHWRVRYWLPATRAVGLPWLTFHDLRRANATALVRAGIDLKTAQTRLGHSDPRLTLAVYAQATTAADRDAADRVAALFQATPAEAEEGSVKGDICAMDVPWAFPRAPPAEAASPLPALLWSGRGDLNPRPQRPERCALTKLRYFPVRSMVVDHPLAGSAIGRPRRLASLSITGVRPRADR
jgi:integrase